MMSSSVAYAAGLVDGEGCIWIGHKRGAYYVAVEIGMTLKARSLLEQMREAWGGTVTLRRAATRRWAEAWSWQASGSQATKVLLAIIPHLRLKKEQAEIGVALQRLRDSLVGKGGRARWTAKASREASHLHRRIRELNAKGPSPRVQTTGPIIALRAGDGSWIPVQADLFSETPSEKSLLQWPSSGMAWDGVAWTRSSSESPSNAVACSLSGILEARVQPKFFLSPQACRGILRRAEKRGRELPKALREALERVAQMTTTPKVAGS